MSSKKLGLQGIAIVKWRTKRVNIILHALQPTYWKFSGQVADIDVDNIILVTINIIIS